MHISEEFITLHVAIGSSSAGKRWIEAAGFSAEEVRAILEARPGEDDGEPEYDTVKLEVNALWSALRNRPGAFGVYYDPWEFMTHIYDEDGYVASMHEVAMVEWCKREGKKLEDAFSDLLWANAPPSIDELNQIIEEIADEKMSVSERRAYDEARTNHDEDAADLLREMASLDGNSLPDEFRCRISEWMNAAPKASSFSDRVQISEDI